MIDLLPEEKNHREQHLNYLKRLAEKLDLNDDVIEKAIHIYDKFLERQLEKIEISDRTLNRGAPRVFAGESKNFSNRSVASLYAACRYIGIPITLSDVSDAEYILLDGNIGWQRRRKKDIARCYRLLLREMDLRMPVVDPTKCVSRIASKAGLSEKTELRAVQILNIAKDTHTSAGKRPMALAASALYLACEWEGEGKAEKEVAEAAGVSKNTVKIWYKVLDKMYNKTLREK